jgi:type VI secretion system protein ImpH
MESTSGKPHSNLKAQLFEQSRSFTFNQAYRLINLLLKEELGDSYSNEQLLQQIRIRPELSLNFPSSDIAQIKETFHDGKFGCEITATFLGLYGSSSPLPTFYTEDLFNDENENSPIVREFIDILNNHLYQLFFKIWSTHRLSYQLFEANNPNYFAYLYSLGGLADENAQKIIPNQYNILRYIGLMGHLPRSALGLKTLLSDLLEIKQIEIIQCRNTVISIPVEQRLSLLIWVVRW